MASNVTNQPNAANAANAATGENGENASTTAMAATATTAMKPTVAPAIIVLGRGAIDTARRVQACLPGAQLHGLAKRVAEIDGVDILFSDLSAHLRQLYASGIPIVGLCAAGILIRCLAPEIGARIDVSAKTVEPPVLALAEDGSAVVPLLGGLGGVNTLARIIGDALAVSPAITTSGELRFGQCLLDPPPGYRLADLEQGKRFVSDLLAGRQARIDGDAPWLLCAPQIPLADDADRVIRVSIERHTSPDTLLIHPKAVIVAVSDPLSDPRSDPRSAPRLEPIRDSLPALPPEPQPQPTAAAQPLSPSTALVDRIAMALDQHGIATAALAALLFDARYIGDLDIARACGKLRVPARFIAPDAGLSEPAGANRPDASALIDAAGLSAPDIRHIVRSGSVTIVAAARPLDVGLIGMAATVETETGTVAETIAQARGSLTVIGIGPGSKALLAPAASQALADADDILGYTTYTDMAGPFRPNQRVHSSNGDNREELQRARHAFALAATGRHVVMVSSGDPGVFAMAAAVIEALEHAVSASAVDAQHAALAEAWSAVELSIVPGISAAMATAAVAGAPLGHDFCMISLSDNLKPWSVIERRLQLAAEADLAMAFYNPISRARPWQLDRALEIVRALRGPRTPVILGRNIDRPGASLTTLTLGALRSEQVDMRTMVIVGSSTTRRFTTSHGREWVYTPRWYPDVGANASTPPVPPSQE